MTSDAPAVLAGDPITQPPPTAGMTKNVVKEPVRSAPANRLQSIDSLRGIAAIGVAVYHFTGSYANAPFWSAFGFTGVYLFFVISGFCIHLRAATGTEPDFLGFWKRRWRRLYPAYLASFLLYIWWTDFNWFLVYDVISHLLMLHNLDARTVYSMNGVWWTLAVEEQLYLLYFVLLWMRRKWGWAVVLATTFLLRFVVLGVSLAFHQMGVDIPFSESALSNWWIWALGALSVEAYMGIVRLPRVFYSLTFAAAILIAAGGLFHAGIVSPGTIVSQAAAVFTPLLWGLAFFTIVNRCVRDGLGLRSLAFVGLFSYSLYLTHEFVIRVVPFGLLIGFSISLAFAYAFFRVFEKPFMKSADHKSRSGTRTGIDSFDTSPA